ncbi:MAG: BMP family ABC transporter substrate-binding protein [Oscillibacter sp.]|jgi:basic membrane protein A|nr:BMP family ABC transporter substrate-binding protein [Oscillibacter sp.]
MKNKFKTLLAVLCLVAMVASLAGCGSKGAAPSASASAAGSDSASGLKICIITSSGIDDGSFNQNCYEGIQAFLADHADCTVNDVKESDYNELIPTVERLVGDYDVFVLPGFNFSGIGDIATNNPDKKFIVVDSTITDSEGNALTLDNVYTMTFSEQQGGFFAGIAAALTTTTGKVAVVNGMAYPSNVNYQYGFMSGVNYANANYGTSAQCIELPSYAGTDVMGNAVGGNYIGDFTDEATGKVVAESLIDQGCDILFIAAGNAGNGCFTAIKEATGVYAIGCDVDQFDDGVNGSSNIILTSTLKVMDENVCKQLTAIYDGTFQGQDAYLGADTDSSGYVSADGRQQLSEDALAKLAECYDLVKDGTIVPAADATVNEYLPDSFPGLS